MNDSNPHARLYTRDEFAKLTRDGMYKALVYVSPTLAKGKSRARQKELIELYDLAANTDSIPVVKVSETGAEALPPAEAPPPADPEKMAAAALSVDAALSKTHHYEDGEPDCTECGAFGPNTAPDEKCPGPMHPDPEINKGVLADMKEAEEFNQAHGIPDFSEEAVAQQKHQDISMSNHSDELPKVAGVEELQRVNPEMPTLELKDGAVFQMAPDPKDLLFTFKDAPRELTEKDKVLIDSVQKNFEAFRTNPANNEAKRKTKADIYALKVLGIIVNPRLMEVLKEGRDYVRDVRRKHQGGVDVAETVRESQKDQKERDMVRDMVRDASEPT